ncbi:MAG: cyclin family protein [Promethearchaeota archaeon]
MSNSKKIKNWNRTTENCLDLPNNYALSAPSVGELTCDCCFSHDIIETLEGYVCRTCGVVQQLRKLQYDHPYNEKKIQNAIMGTTQLGLARERFSQSRSEEFRRLNKLQNIKNNEESAEDRARIEIKRIFTSLDLPSAYKDMIFKKFLAIRSKLGAGTKYRSPEKLVPIVIYFVLKLNSYIIHQKELLEVSKISKKDFNSFKIQMQRYMPQYQERNRREFISRKILAVTEYFELGMPYYHFCRDILENLWRDINNTKDDVVAGLVCSIGILAGGYDEQKYISIFRVCKHLNIQMSTIQGQVKKRIFENFKILGFSTLIQSKNTLKLFLVKRHLLDVEVEAQVNEVQIQRQSLKASLSFKVKRIVLKGEKEVFNALRETFAEHLIDSFYGHAQTNLDSSEYQEDPLLPENGRVICIDEKGENSLILQFFSGKGPPTAA